MKRTLLLAVAMAGIAAAANAAPMVSVGVGHSDIAAAGVSAVFLLAAFDLAGNPHAPRWARLAHFHTLRALYGLRRTLGDAIRSYLFAMGLALRVFPQTVKTDLAFGIVGELAFDGPTRAQAGRINNAATAANCVVGRWFTQAADGTWSPGGAGAAGGGVLMNPKNYPNVGSGGVPLAPNMLVVPGTVAEFLQMGEIVVAVTTAVAMGQPAYFVQADGTIGAGAPGAGQTAIPNSNFVRYANAAAGLAVLRITN